MFRPEGSLVLESLDLGEGAFEVSRRLVFWDGTRGRDGLPIV